MLTKKSVWKTGGFVSSGWTDSSPLPLLLLLCGFSSSLGEFVVDVLLEQMRIGADHAPAIHKHRGRAVHIQELAVRAAGVDGCACFRRSEEHTSELQSQSNLVCRLLLEKKKI